MNCYHNYVPDPLLALIYNVKELGEKDNPYSLHLIGQFILDAHWAILGRNFSSDSFRVAMTVHICAISDSLSSPTTTWTPSQLYSKFLANSFPGWLTCVCGGETDVARS
jgi:hypothetical protein